MAQITTLGIDTAKHVFQLHGVDQQGQVVRRKRVTRTPLLPLLAQLPPCLVGLEACGGSHTMRGRSIGKINHFSRAPRASISSHLTRVPTGRASQPPPHARAGCS
jgi:transposase